MSDTPTSPTIADLAKFMKQDADNAGGSMFIPPHIWTALATHIHEPDKLETMFHALIESGAIKVFHKPDGAAE